MARGGTASSEKYRSTTPRSLGRERTSGDFGSGPRVPMAAPLSWWNVRLTTGNLARSACSGNTQSLASRGNFLLRLRAVQEPGMTAPSPAPPRPHPAAPPAPHPNTPRRVFRCPLAIAPGGLRTGLQGQGSCGPLRLRQQRLGSSHRVPTQVHTVVWPLCSLVERPKRRHQETPPRRHTARWPLASRANA